MASTPPARPKGGPLDPSSDVVIENPLPLVRGGRFSFKAIAGDPFRLEADVFSYGHQLVRALALVSYKGSRRKELLALREEGNDHFSVELVARREGPFEIELLAEVDALSSWARDAKRRLEAGALDHFEPVVAAELIEAAAERLQGAGESGAEQVRALAARALRGVDAELLAELDALAPVLSRRPTGEEATSFRLKGIASRERAVFSSWYELFPRSASPDRRRPGTLKDVMGRLSYLSELGFDVLYLPPIHPIGVTGRKGRGNSPKARRGDVGSPWAIGSEAGGHTAIAPQLGTIDDFDELVLAADKLGIEIALDLAFQCSPDHPWVREHPEWFRHRPDGSITCAENPPKRYEDIYPLDFETTDRAGLFEALAEVVSFWTARGVRIFRVDNPHTKPFSFWEWLIARSRRETPGVLFLAEAFTRPKVMHRLAALGFDQSYTYFTWRNERFEIEQYFKELTSPPDIYYFRPNVWPNTPDILAASLQSGGRASFIARFVLAAGLSASYGIYGPVFELGWDEPAAPGSEEYKSSEKYEVHHHDLDDPASIAPLIARVNSLRRENAALRRNEELLFHRVDNEKIICWSKRARNGEWVIGVVSLDPHFAQSGSVDIAPGALGLSSGESFGVRDVLSGEEYRWRAGENFVHLDPALLPAHLLVGVDGR